MNDRVFSFTLMEKLMKIFFTSVTAKTSEISSIIHFSLAKRTVF